MPGTRNSPLDISSATYRKVVAAGTYWLHRVNAGQTFRIVDVGGNQAADTLFYSVADTAERYSAVDTMRAQGGVYLGVDSPLISNAGRTMLRITADTVGRHDTLGGACSAESNTVRYSLDKRCMHSCRDTWMLAISENAQYGLTKRDITHNINFFMNVPITQDGGLTFEDGLSGPGHYVEMQAAMDVLVLISVCPQLNNPCNGYDPTPLEMIVWDRA